MEDLGTWAKPWTIEVPVVASNGPIYEYACHEGNYAMTDILSGAQARSSRNTAEVIAAQGRKVVRPLP